MVKKKTTNKRKTDKKEEKAFKGEYLVISPSKQKSENIVERVDNNTPRMYINLPKKTNKANANRFFKPQRRITPKPPKIR